MINENLKSLRKIHQYTQEELAEKLNVSRQSIAKWESGVFQTKGYY
ncbi:transcriptional regulator [Clostridioides difficile]|nr:MULTISPECIES: helix-turn-helix transcriptional regulator [Clostridia]OFU29994.1 transcriptional regulator [Clostridium sp. HMSC19B11]PBE15680.1 transcriptional regulator [Clostridioides difficile]PBH27733.1 transcriptional regulator [Clostridioides difficile]